MFANKNGFFYVYILFFLTFFFSFASYLQAQLITFSKVQQLQEYSKVEIHLIHQIKQELPRFLSQEEIVSYTKEYRYQSATATVTYEVPQIQGTLWYKQKAYDFIVSFDVNTHKIVSFDWIL